MGQVTEDRWQRLVDEHHRQEAARAVDEEQRYRQERPWWTLVLTLGVVAWALAFLAFGWWSLERARREDPSRCPDRGGEVEVALGGWAEPDMCYYPVDGDLLAGGSFVAGPATRSYDDVLDDNAAEIKVVATVFVLGATAAIGWWWSRPLRRSRSAG